MNAFFSSPSAFLALLAIPALVAIYLLRNRFRVHHVSSLILWQDQKTARQGGLNLERIQTPLLFLLELLTIVMLSLAAAGPMMRAGKHSRVFVIVLDNSFSMLAKDGATARERAVEKIQRLLSGAGDFQAHFILAGKTPQLMGEPVTSAAQAADALDTWRCLAPAADLSKGVALGSELAGDIARILVVTDHQPEAVPEQGRVEWWAFGRPQSNLAFVSADRTVFDGRERCFLAVVNFSDQPVTSAITIESLDGRREAARLPLELEPHQVHRMFLEPDADSAGLRARLEDDGLDIDNEVILVSESPKPLRVRVDIENEALRSAVAKALKAIKDVRITSAEPHLLITGAGGALLSVPSQWTVQIVCKSDSAAYVGPFVVDRSHPLTEGLSLDGLIWGAAKESKRTGVPVIAAGNVPLITERESPINSRAITMNLNPDFSTLLQSPNWPILIWNLVQWRKSFLPGLAQSNILLGTSATFARGPGENELLLTDPASRTENIPMLAEAVLIQPDMPGLYELKTERNQYRISVNAISKSESDLTAAATGKWGEWRQAHLFWWEYQPLDWLMLLIGLALLTAHRFITATNQEGVRA